MKPITILVLLFCLSSTVVFGQVKIGDNPQTIDAASVLELEGTDKVLVITRVNNLTMESITPLRGAVLYNTDTQCLHYYNGAEWINLCDAVSFSLTNDPIVNTRSTISITDNGGTINLEVAPNSIRSENIVDGGINGDDIQDNSIGESKLGADSVGANELRDNSVGSIEVIDGSITVADIANSGPNQILTTDATGIVNWVDATNVRGVATDLSTITGTGIEGDELAVSAALQAIIDNNSLGIEDNAAALLNETTRATAAEAQNTADINDLQADKENISNKDTNINLGTSNDAYPSQNAVKAYVDAQIGGLNTLANGNIYVGDATNAAQEVAINGDATMNNAGFLTIDPNAVTTGKLANNAVTSIKINNATILAEDLNQMGAANNQILKWNGTNWAPAVDATGSTVTDTGANDGLSNFSVTTGYNINVDDSTIEINADALRIKDNAVSSAKIANATILAEDLNQMGALDGQVLKWENDINGWIVANDLTNGTGIPLLTNGTLLIGDAVNAPQERTIIGDATIDNTGTLTINENAVTPEKLAPGTVAGQLLQWDGNDWVYITEADISATVVEVDAIIGNEVSAVADTTLELSGAGTDTDPLTIDVANLGIGTDELAEDAVTLPKLAPGTVAGQLLQWDGNDWVYITEADISATVVEVDAIIGNEVSAVADTTLELSGAGTDTDPLTIDVANLGIGTDELAEDAVTLPKLAPGTVAGQLLQWDGNDWVYITEADISGFTGTAAGSIFFSAPTTFNPTENNSELFWDNTNDVLGIGTNTPDTSGTIGLHVFGSTRSGGFITSDGSANTPSYRFNNDSDTGMFWGGSANQLGFSVGQIEALRIRREGTTDSEIIFNGSLELTEQLIDENGNVGNEGDILKATATGTQWSEPTVVAMGKVNGGNSINVNGVTVSGSGLLGTISVNFLTPRPNDDYIIQLTVVGDNRIFVTGQTTNNFNIEIRDRITNVLAVAEWFFTVSDF